MALTVERQRISERHGGLALFAALNAASAWFGAVGLITGWLSVGERVEARLPWHSPVLAGLALAVVVATPCSALAALAWRGDPRTRVATIATGAAMIGWIVVQVLVIRTFSVFQPLYGAIGIALVLVGRTTRHTTRR